MRARTALDLLDWPYVFSQRHILTSTEFLDEAKQRGVRIEIGHLMELHRIGRLAPFLQASDRLWSRVQPRRREELREKRDAGELIEGGASTYAPWSRFYPRQAAGRYGWTDRWLYSPYQLLFLERLDLVINHMKPVARKGWGLQFRARDDDAGPEPWPRELLRLLTLIEPRFLPGLRGAYTIPTEGPRDTNERARRYLTWLDQWKAKPVPGAIGIEPNWAAWIVEQLGPRVYFLDPNEAWFALTRHANYESWSKLKGAARFALDFRIACEMLLRFHEQLVVEKQIAPLATIPPLQRHPFAERLHPGRATLEADLTELGLSPHPRVIVLVEGATEFLVLPAVMRALGMPVGPSDIYVVNAGGADRDVSGLVVALALPPVTPSGQQGWVFVDRPQPRVIISMDPEGNYRPEKLSMTRAHIFSELRVAMRRVYDQEVAEAQLRQIVRIRVWTLPFEFAVLSDAELARAITSCGVLVTSEDVQRARRAKVPAHALKKLLEGPPQIAKANLARAIAPILIDSLEKRRLGDTLQTHSLGRLLVFIERQRALVIDDRTALQVLPSDLASS